MRIKAILLVTALSVAGMATGATAGGKATTTLKLNAMFEALGDTVITGDIKSSRKACKNNRKVTVYRQQGGADERIGSTRSAEGKGNTYSWVVVKDNVPSGSYYAKSRPTDRCKGDKSNVFDYEAAP